MLRSRWPDSWSNGVDVEVSRHRTASVSSCRSKKVLTMPVVLLPEMIMPEMIMPVMTNVYFYIV